MCMVWLAVLILQCLECVFQYLQLLKECGPQEKYMQYMYACVHIHYVCIYIHSVYREIQTLEQNRFTFKEEVNVCLRTRVFVYKLWSVCVCVCVWCVCVCVCVHVLFVCVGRSRGVH